MTIFDIAAILIAVAAMFGYVNHRVLRLPQTSGTLLVALVSSLAIVAIEQLLPDVRLQRSVQEFLQRIDFDRTLMHGFLCFLLFAGALHVDLEGLVHNRWTIGLLSTIGVLLSTAIVGALTWMMFRLLGIGLDIFVCLTFGALISPTDPIAVMGLLKEVHAPRDLESQIAGESLFNDGVGVVVFLALASVAHLGGGAPDMAATSRSVELMLFAARQVVGGVGVGLALGYVAYRALKSINDHPLELLITLALVMFLYSVSFWIQVSGPIAVVVAGLLIGNPGRRFAMSDETRVHVDGFWTMIDEILNAVLFLLLGLEILAVRHWSDVVVPALLAIPICLFARFVSVGLPVQAMRGHGAPERGLIPVLTWSGLRGGISVALVLALPRFDGKDILLASTYAVVVFSILVQGLTMRPLLAHYHIGQEHRR
jgi:CPA1 family monovalent cation:H+ antiporter